MSAPTIHSATKKGAGQMKQSRIQNITGSLTKGAIFALALGALTGCGGGSSSPVSLAPTASVQITGQVLVPEEALAGRTASAAQAAKDKDYDKGLVSDKPVARAEVVFVPDTGGQPVKSETDEQGNFTITVPKKNNNEEVKGLLKAKSGNTELVSRVEAEDTKPETKSARNITVESTAAVELKKLDSMKDVSVKELEDLVKSGQAPKITEKIVFALVENKPVEVTQEELSEDEEEAQEVEVVTRKDCMDGRQWCLLMTRPKLVKNQNLYRTKLVLIKVSKKAQDTVPDGTVGAGLANVRWPVGAVYDSYETAIAARGRFGIDGIVASVNPKNAEGETTLSFLFREKDPKNPRKEKKVEERGFDQGRVAVLFVYLKGALATEEGNKITRATVTHQKIRGILAEKRSAQAAPNI